MKIEYSKKQQNNPQQEINRGNHFKSGVPGGVSELADGKNEKKRTQNSVQIQKPSPLPAPTP